MGKTWNRFERDKYKPKNKMKKQKDYSPKYNPDYDYYEDEE